MAGSQRIAEFLIGLGGDSTDIDKVLAGVTTSVQKTVTDLQRITAKLNLFTDLENSLPGVQRALDSAKDKVSQFAAEIAKIEATGGKAPKALVDGLAQAEKAAASASRELSRQTQELNSLQAALSKAGVNTNALAAEQLRLAEASKAASAAAQEQAAKQALGLTTLKDIQPEIQRLRTAYDALKASGTLSAKEITIAQSQLDAKLKELNASVSKSGSDFRAFAAEGKAAFTAFGGPLLAAVGGIAAVTASLTSAVAAAKEFRQAVAESSASTDFGKEKLADFGAEAQKLAQTVGVSSVDAVKSLFGLLRTGVSEENVFEVLRISAEAAKASMTDVGTGAKLAKLLLNDFKVPTDQLGRAFDVLRVSVTGSKDGFEAFTNSAGPLLAVARASGIGLEDLGATLLVLRKNGLDAEESIGLLQKIIVQIGSPEVRQKLHALGIDSSDLVSIFRQLGQQGRTLENVLDLTGVSKKAAGAIAVLVNNYDQLEGALNKTQNAAGATQKALANLHNTPNEVAEKYQATLDITKQKVGALAGSTGQFTIIVTSLLAALNDYLEDARKLSEAENQQEAVALRRNLAMLGFKQALDEIKAPTEEFHQALIAQTAALKPAGEAIQANVDKLKLLGDALEKNVPVLEKSVQEQIALIRQRSEIEIAELDKSLAAQVATERKRLEIQTKANTDILGAVQAGQKLINQAVETAVAARTEIERQRIIKGKGDEEQYAKDISAIRLNALQAELTNAQKIQKDLIDQRSATQQKLNQIDQSRIAFNEQIEQSIKAVRQTGLSGLQEFAEKQVEVDKLIAKAREVAATQGISAAEKYFKEAETLSKSLTGEVQSDGTVVVSALEGQQTALKKLTQVRDAYNKASADAREREKTGFAETTQQLKSVDQTVQDLQTKVLALRAATEQAIKLSVSSDIRGIDEAKRQLDELTKDRFVNVVVRNIGGSGTGAGGGGEQPIVEGHNRGGFIGQVQRFASGGSVFNRPSWLKVPGSGSGDTVPAALEAGSFVMSNKAVRKYGDSVIGRLARGFQGGGAIEHLASGGTAGDNTIANVVSYAKWVLQYLRAPIFDFVRPLIGDGIRRLEQRGHENDTGYAAQLLQLVRDQAVNFHLQDFFGRTTLGVTRTGTPDLPDFAEWLASQPEVTPPRRFASGGSADTVPAMLEPGEWVIPRRIAEMLGGGFLHALNSTKLSAGDLMSRVAPPMMPMRFALGGPVPGTAIPDRPYAQASLPDGWHQQKLPVGSGDVNITINAAGGDISDPRTIRLITNGIREQLRRSGDTLGSG